jgi:hypothetical protein
VFDPDRRERKREMKKETTERETKWQRVEDFNRKRNVEK